jgi:Flp pilus assembly pilin Flp
MLSLFRRLWTEERGQDIAEYAVMLAVILVVVVGTIRMVGSNANNVFSSVSSSIQQQWEQEHRSSILHIAHASRAGPCAPAP